MKSIHEISIDTSPTERKSAGGLGHEQKNALLNAALDCIVTMDHIGIIIEWNKAAEKVFGYTQAYAIGKNLADLIIPERYREAHRRGLARYLATGEQVVLNKRLEMSALRANGEEFPVELTITNLELGKEPLFTGFMRDLSEQKKLEQTKANFFGNVSHELRTPLHLILEPAVDALQDHEQPLPARQRERLTLIYSNALRLLKLANSVLDFSKIEAGQLKAHYESVDLVVLTSELIEAFRTAIEKAGLTLQVNLTPLEEPVYVDTDMWERMVFNLLSNALKYTTTGGITITLNKQEGKVILQVADTGTGIPENELGNIFKRFHHVENTQGRTMRGAGIGLALTQEFIKLHGGSIQAKSQLRKGSVFTLTLPLGRAHLPQQQVSEIAGPHLGRASMRPAFVSEAMQWLPEAGGKEEKQKKDEHPGKDTSLEPMPDVFVPGTLPEKRATEKILLVEDNAGMRHYLNHLLAEHWNVRLAENGKIALEAVLKEKPALILSDVMLPEMDGFQLMKALRQNPKTADIPIIFLSAQADEEARAGGLEKGADDYLTKPFSARELIARVKTQLELRQMRTQLEEKVQQQTLELQLLSAVAPVGIFRCNAAGAVSYVSPRACEIIGQTEDHIKGLDWINALHPADKERIIVLWNKTVQDKAERFKAEFRYLRQDGTTVWIVNEATAEKDESGQIKGYVNALTDITEWKDLEKARFNAVEQAEEQYRHRAEDAEAYRKKQEQFIDTMCHELRNPLNGIYGNVNLLEMNLAALEKLIDAMEPTQLHESRRQELLINIMQGKEAIRAIDTCARHQKVITDDVLHLSKLEAGKIELNPTDFDPKKVVQDVVDMLDTEVKRKKIQLYVELLHNELRVNGDRSRLAQILLNLLSNAIKFTPERGKVWVRMSQEEVTENHTLLQFTVQDTGIGMTDSEKAKIFDRFMQATRSTYSEYGGSGLGLAISKNLVGLMGGRIEVESKKEVGSKFTFTVKCKTVPLPQKVPPLSLFFEHPLPVPKIVQRRLLIVEDNLINQKILQRNLEKAGHSCDIASNGQEAYEMSGKNPYDIILMDIEMPVMDGIEATKMIRQRESAEKRRPVPIIGLSGNAREEYHEIAKSAGMNDYLTKPYERTQLLEKIATHSLSFSSSMSSSLHP